MSTSPLTFLASAVVVDALGDFDGMDDAALVSAVRLLADHARATSALQARGAAVVAQRSDPAVGFSGLAKRHGSVNAESFLQSVTGGTTAEAVKLVRAGELLNTSTSADSSGWEGVLGGALGTGTVSVDAVNAIRIGLSGAGTSAASPEELVTATGMLLEQADRVDADELTRLARHARDELDADGIARRETERRGLRYFTARHRDDGIVVGSFALSDEDGAMVMAIYQQATSPKHAGPKFVETGSSNVANAGVDADADGSGAPLPVDPRTRGQKAADVFAGLIRIGTETDGKTVLGLNRPSVRIHVTAGTVAAQAGHGVIEDVNDYPISFATVERHLCTSGIIGVAFDDDGQSLNAGRDQRLFTRKQRIALAARDGGCRFPDCDRPVSWTEAHHTKYWHRDQGDTNVADGILLCRLHHLLIHDNHWDIRRDRGHYWLTAPPNIDPGQTPRNMPSKQPLVRALQHA